MYDLSSESSLRERLPRVSLHSLPPFDAHGPLPAIGYLKGYLEKHRPGICVTAAYWHQALPRLVRPWSDDRLLSGDGDSCEEFWDAAFALRYLREAAVPDHRAAEFLDQ